MSSKSPHHYVFIDESGDPGKLFREDAQGNRVPTGASEYYILSAVCVDSKALFALENRILEIRQKYGYRSEIKSTSIPLSMYKDLLDIINELEIKVYYRLVDKKKYTGKFATNGNKKLHNIFDEYNIAKVTHFALKMCGLLNADVVIDRAERRLWEGDFESFNEYLKKRVNTKTIQRIKYVTHVDSEYVNAMQLSDLVSGAIKDSFTGRNKDLKKVIKKKYLYKIF